MNIEDIKNYLEELENENTNLQIKINKNQDLVDFYTKKQKTLKTQIKFNKKLIEILEKGEK